MAKKDVRNKPKLKPARTSAKKTRAKSARARTSVKKTHAKPEPAATKKTKSPASRSASEGRSRQKTPDYSGMREALLRLRERITGQINFLATDNLNRTQNDAEINFRSEEQGTDNYDRDFALTRVSFGQDIVFEIDQALNRLAMGVYGLCESCGRAIEKQRMAALPYSRMCVACQSRSEVDRKRMRAADTSAMYTLGDKSQMEPSAEDE